MTDNDIIKALEHCTSSTTSEACNGCPLFSTTICTEMENGLQIYALNLINRQKAEIEKYELVNKEKFNNWMRLEKRTKERYAELYKEAKSVVRAEAIKEFWERLQKDFSEVFAKEHPCVLSEIDDLVKEMTEGEDGSN